MGQTQTFSPDGPSGLTLSDPGSLPVLGLSCPREGLFGFRDRGLGLSQPHLRPCLEVNMQSIRKNPTRLKTDSFPAVSLFLKWFLCRTTLEKNKSVKKLLALMDEGKVVDQEKWADLLRKRLLRTALYALNSLLERPVNHNELAHIYGRIEEFIQLYAMGLRT